MKNQKAILLILSMLTTLSCMQERKEIHENPQISEAKWAMYYLNYGSKAVYFDDTTVSFSLLECELSKPRSKQSNDTLEIFFSFRKSNKDSLRKIQLTPWYNHVYGIGFINSKVRYPIHGDFVFDFVKDSISVRRFMDSSEQSFKNYIRTYQGEISPWLFGELKRRKLR